LASVPLTDEDWTPLLEGEVLAVRSGVVVDRQAT
jgi:predicted glutamine amidotransferase